MEDGHAMGSGVGLRLALEGKKTLTIGEADLVLFGTNLEPHFTRFGRATTDPTLTLDRPGLQEGNAQLLLSHHLR